MKFPYRIFYIVSFLVLPIAVIVIFTYADSINNALFPDASSEDNNIRGVIMIPVFLFLFSMNTVPRKMPEFVRIGYKRAKQAHFALRVIRRFWLAVIIFSLGIYGAQLLYIASTGQFNYLLFFPEFAWLPITVVSSALWYVLSMAVFSGWDNNQHFRLYMARETGKDASTKQTRFERVKALIESIRWYDQYIRIALSTKIANLEGIIYTLTTQTPENLGKQISLFYKAFDSGDELEPLNLITTLDNTNTTGFESSESFLTKLKNVELIVAIIVGVATIIATLVNIFG